MNQTKRVTVYLDADLHRALRLKSVASDRSVSEMVNLAVRRSLVEDAEDLAAFDERSEEPTLDFDEFVRTLSQDGKL